VWDAVVVLCGGVEVEHGGLYCFQVGSR
jgi:hypothetical protein